MLLYKDSCITPIHYRKGEHLDSRQASTFLGTIYTTDVYLGNAIEIPSRMHKICVRYVDTVHKHWVEEWYIDASSDTCSQMYHVLTKVYSICAVSVIVDVDSLVRFYEHYQIAESTRMTSIKPVIVDNAHCDCLDLSDQQPNFDANKVYDVFNHLISRPSILNACSFRTFKTSAYDDLETPDLSRIHISNTPWFLLYVSDMEEAFVDTTPVYNIRIDECSLRVVRNIMGNGAINKDNHWVDNYIPKYQNQFCLTPVNLAMLTKTKFRYPTARTDGYKNDGSHLNGYERISLFDHNLLRFCNIFLRLPAAEIELNYILPNRDTDTNAVLSEGRFNLIGYSGYFVDRDYILTYLNHYQSVFDSWNPDVESIGIVKTKLDELYFWCKIENTIRKYYVDLTLAAILSHEFCYNYTLQ